MLDRLLRRLALCREGPLVPLPPDIVAPVRVTLEALSRRRDKAAEALAHCDGPLFSAGELEFCMTWHGHVKALADAITNLEKLLEPNDNVPREGASR